MIGTATDIANLAGGRVQIIPHVPIDALPPRPQTVPLTLVPNASPNETGRIPGLFDEPISSNGATVGPLCTSSPYRTERNIHFSPLRRFDEVIRLAMAAIAPVLGSVADFEDSLRAEISPAPPLQASRGSLAVATTCMFSSTRSVKASPSMLMAMAAVRGSLDSYQDASASYNQSNSHNGVVRTSIP